MSSTGVDAGETGKNKADKAPALMELILTGETVNTFLRKIVPEDIVL